VLATGGASPTPRGGGSEPPPPPMLLPPEDGDYPSLRVRGALHTNHCPHDLHFGVRAGV
jgi:hypothetical protein